MKTSISLQNLSLQKDNEHRMEFVREFNGVTYVNDSKSTDIKQTVESIDGLDADIVLIIGGKDEKTDYSWFLNVSLRKIKSVIYLGEDTSRLFRIFGKQDVMFVKAETLIEAVFISQTLAKENQVVLFSPACPSYDTFDNYKNRGNQFKQLVSELNS